MNSQPEPSGSQAPKAAGIETAHDDGLEFEPEPASSQPPTMPGGDNAPPGVWYVARPGRPQLGPITLVALKKQLVAGTLSPADLVWKAGMPGWVRAETIPDLSAAPPGVPLPLARNGFDRNADLLRHLNAILAGAAFYRVIGRSCAGLGVIIFLGSLLLSYWQWTWFTGAMLPLQLHNSGAFRVALAGFSRGIKGVSLIRASAREFTINAISSERIIWGDYS